jgi:aspartate 1-decarboxylase
VQKGDIVIIMSYVMLSEPEISAHQPKVVLVDEHNKIRDIIHYEPPHTVL